MTFTPPQVASAPVDPGPRILLSEWAGDTSVPQFLGDVNARPSCPICGHPTMDCTTDPHSTIDTTP